MQNLRIKETILELDEEGHLIDYEAWTPEVARALAEREGIEALTEEHLEILMAIRQYYDRFKVAPMVHMLAKEYGKTYRELHHLFKKQPGKRAAKLAGLSKAQGCV